MRNTYIKKCVRKDGTIDIVIIEGGNIEKSEKPRNISHPESANALESESTTESVAIDKVLSRIINLETGLVLRNVNDLRKIMKKGRAKLDYNIVNRNKTCLLFRLGYYPHSYDIKRAGKDFERFIRRIRNKYEKEFGTINYFTVLDLYEDFSLHFHGILYAPKTAKRLWIKPHIIKELWGQGTVRVQLPNKDTHFDYILPQPTNSTSKEAKHIREKFNRYLYLPKQVKIFRSGGFENPLYSKISLDEYEALKADRIPNVFRKFSYDFSGNGSGIVTYTYETFYKKD